MKFDRNQGINQINFLLLYWMQTFEQIISWQNWLFIDALFIDLRMFRFCKVIIPERIIFTDVVTKGLNLLVLGEQLSYKPTGSTNTLFRISRYPGLQERNRIIHFLKNTCTCTSTLRQCCFDEQSYYHDLVSHYVLSMFLNFGHFSALCSYKKGQ